MAEVKLVIFIVDDDDIYLQVLKHHFEKKFEAVVYTYTTSEICLTNLHLNPDIIILDYSLDSVYHDAMDGMAMLKEINKRNQNGGKEIYAIMLSKQDDIKIAVDTMKNGAYDYIIKGNTADKKLEIVINNIRKQIVTKRSLDEVQAMKKMMLYIFSAILIIALLFYLLSPMLSKA